jgi:hypothetical protein
MEHTPEEKPAPRVRWSEISDRFAHAVITYLVSLLLTMPLLIILLPFVPALELPWSGGVRVDHILTFVLIFAAFVVIVRRLRLLVYMALVIGILVVAVTSMLGTFTFGDAYESYASLLRSLRDTTLGTPLAAKKLSPFHDAEKLRHLVLNADPSVRKAAVKMATANFTDLPTRNDEHVLVQSFSIFKEINHNWKYVSDMKGGEYFAPPDESLELMAGDCDDHAVLMAACIKAIGGEVRLIRTEGHVYPEMKVGDDARMERAAYLIRKVLFPKEVGDAPLYHHTDADGQHWINLDYTRRYPGGELMSERIVGVLEL